MKLPNTFVSFASLGFKNVKTNHTQLYSTESPLLFSHQVSQCTDLLDLFVIVGICFVHVIKSKLRNNHHRWMWTTWRWIITTRKDLDNWQHRPLLLHYQRLSHRLKQHDQVWLQCLITTHHFQFGQRNEFKLHNVSHLVVKAREWLWYYCATYPTPT